MQEYCKPARHSSIFCTPLRMTHRGKVIFLTITHYCHLERSRNPRRSEALTKTPRACRKDLYKRLLLALLTISNILFRFSLALIHRRFRSHTRAFFTLTRVKKVRLRAGSLSCSSPFAYPLHSARRCLQRKLGRSVMTRLGEAIFYLIDFCFFPFLSS